MTVMLQRPTEMKNCTYLCLFLLKLVCLYTSVYGGYLATVELLTYENPKHFQAQSKDCCEVSCTPCDNRFTFCFSDNKTVSEYKEMFKSRPEECACGCQYTTGLVEKDNDNLTFIPGQSVDGEVPNPLVFRGHRWPGSATLLVIVYDIDVTNVDDVVDAILVPISSDIGRGYSGARPYTGIYQYGKLRARFRVDCDDNYYGQDCTTYCKDSDNELKGHFVCDSDGNKTCLEGYKNVSSNCTECVPSNGCSQYGGFCTKPGECICHPGYSGNNCTYQYEPGSNASQIPVYILSVVTGFLTLLILILLVVMFALCAALWRKNVNSDRKEESSGEYVNEGLGPSITSVDNTEYNNRTAVRLPSSRYYSAINSGHRVAAINQDVTTGQSRTGRGDVPSLSMQPNIAYNVEFHSTSAPAQRTRNQDHPQ